MTLIRTYLLVVVRQPFKLDAHRKKLIKHNIRESLNRETKLRGKLDAKKV
jgi:hypothetical protein